MITSYDKMFGLILEVSKEDLEHYKGRPSRKKVKKEMSDEQALKLARSGDPDAPEWAKKLTKKHKGIKYGYLGENEKSINEIGDTAKGREKIRQALHNRRVELDVAQAVSKDNPIGVHKQHPAQLVKLARGAYQIAKVKAYLKGKATGGQKGAIEAFKAAKRRQAKDVAAVERQHPQAPNVYSGDGEPTGAGVRSAIRNMTYRNRQLRRHFG